MVIESFSGYSSLGWHLSALRVCMTSDQDLLAFRIYVKKFGIILICLPLYITWPFCLTTFNILCFCFVDLVFYYYVMERFFFLVQSLVICKLLVCSLAALSTIHRQMDVTRKYHPEWGDSITKNKQTTTTTQQQQQQQKAWYAFTDKWILAQKLRISKIQSMDHIKLKKNDYCRCFSPSSKGEQKYSWD